MIFWELSALEGKLSTDGYFYVVCMFPAFLRLYLHEVHSDDEIYTKIRLAETHLINFLAI